MLSMFFFNSSRKAIKVSKGFDPDHDINSVGPDFSSYINIVLIFFSYSRLTGILGSDGKQNTA